MIYQPFFTTNPPLNYNHFSNCIQRSKTICQNDIAKQCPKIPYLHSARDLSAHYTPVGFPVLPNCHLKHCHLPCVHDSNDSSFKCIKICQMVKIKPKTFNIKFSGEKIIWHENGSSIKAAAWHFMGIVSALNECRHGD